MNCRRIEKLMPLFVEGDLDERAMNAVSLHLNDCRNCSCLMSEYSESQSWLRSFAPPEFDSAFFVKLQHSVMQEIERKPTRPTLLQQLIKRWQPSWAMAITMLVLAGALALYLYSGKTANDSGQLISTQDKPEQPPPQQEPREEKPQSETRKNGLKNGHFAALKPRRLLPKHEIKLPDILPIVLPEQSINFGLIAGSLDDNNPIGIGLFEDWAMPVETTRMEFQTSDPNIRIIWFAPKVNSSQAAKIDTD